MLLLLSPKGAIGGWGSESDGFGNATWLREGEGGRRCAYRGCLASRVTHEIPLFYSARRRETPWVTLSYSYRTNT